jgi:hypothetical protein
MVGPVPWSPTIRALGGLDWPKHGYIGDAVSRYAVSPGGYLKRA